MTIIIVMLFLLCVAFIYVAATGSKKASKVTTVNEVNQNLNKTVNNFKLEKTNESNQGNGYKKNNNTAPRKDMLDFLEFDKISDDMIIQNKETKYSMVLQCKGINYDLMSEIEQLSVEEGFINFLSTLRFPIQLYVQARTIDMKKSINMFKDKVKDINEQYEQKNQTYQEVLANSDSTMSDKNFAEYEKEKMANINEYAADITRYVERLSLNKHMLQRKFYVVLSYYKSELSSTSQFNKEEVHEICNNELYTRAQTIISSLQTSSVAARVLSSNEIAELLYISYNRDDEKLMDIKTALDSGFYRMYSTSKDIYEKKEEVIRKQLEEEAMNRIKIAVEEAKLNGSFYTKDDFIEEFEETVDSAAIEIVEKSSLESNTKQIIQKAIVDNHNAEFEIRQEAKNQKQEIQDETKTQKSQENQDIEKENIINNTSSSDDVIK